MRVGESYPMGLDQVEEVVAIDEPALLLERHYISELVGAKHRFLEFADLGLDSQLERARQLADLLKSDRPDEMTGNDDPSSDEALEISWIQFRYVLIGRPITDQSDSGAAMFPLTLR